MHANFYARHSGFGQRFESMIAGGLAEFGNRLDSPCNSVWTAVRGGRVGRKLLSAALEFVDRQGFSETHLWTFNGSAAARRLYEAKGFACVEAQSGTQ